MKVVNFLDSLFKRERTFKKVFDSNRLLISYTGEMTMEHTATCIELHRTIINLASILQERYKGKKELKEINDILEQLINIMMPLESLFLEINRRMKIMKVKGQLSETKYNKENSNNIPISANFPIFDTEDTTRERETEEKLRREKRENIEEVKIGGGEGVEEEEVKVMGEFDIDEREGVGENTLCVAATGLTTGCIAKLFKNIIVTLGPLYETFVKTKQYPLLVHIGKLSMTKMVLKSSMEASESDIFYLPAEHPDWVRLKNHAEIIEVKDKEKYGKKYKKISQDLMIALSSFYTGFEQETNEFMRLVSTGLNALTFNLSKTGKYQAEYVISNAESKPLIQVYNLMESDLVKPYFWATLPAIKVNRKIYVPKLLPHLTFESLKRAYKNSQKGLIDPIDDLSEWNPNFNQSRENRFTLISENKEKKVPLKRPAEESKGISGGKKLFETNIKKYDSYSNVKIRILSKNKLPEVRWDGKSQKGKVKGTTSDSIIIHYHGGGFVAMSSKSHQHYTRQWANTTGFPVFSVDYRLAPEAKYPDQLDDAWQAYVWIVTQAEEQLAITPRHIILAGDSAGGNLCLVVCLRAIQTHFRLPDGLCLAYPAVNLDMESFTPSTLYALDDVLLRYCFLNICMASYVGEGNVKEDPYLSPFLMSDYDIKQLPPIRMQLAGKDPLRDQSYKFLLRLSKRGMSPMDIQVKDYRDFPHGFWSLGIPGGLKECKVSINDSIEWINELVMLSRARKGCGKSRREYILMPQIYVIAADFFKLLGKELNDEEMEKICFEFGVEAELTTTKSMPQRIIVEEEKEQKVFKVEVPANRIDLLCIEGLAQAIGEYLKIKPSIEYKRIDPINKQQIIAKENTKKIRPFVIGGILRNIRFTAANYNSFITLQDKLHQNIARERTLASIGTHDLDTLKGPFYYEGKEPKDIYFQPLGSHSKMSGVEMMEKFETDLKLRKYLHIINKFELYPIITDSNGVVLSMPPIINGEHSKITLNTKNVLIEVTATDLTRAKVVLNTVVCMFSLYCEDKFSCESLEIVTPEGNTYIYPDLSHIYMDFSIKYGMELIGIDNMDTEGVRDCLQKMGLQSECVDTDKLSVNIPPTRSDIIHQCDIAEDLGIGYGYNHPELVSRLPPTLTIGKQLGINRFSDLLRRELALSGFNECLTLSLLSKREQYEMLRGVYNVEEAVEIANPKTVEFQILRTTLLPGMLKSLAFNMKSPIPIQLFEISDVVRKDPTSDTGASNHRHISVLYCSKSSGFEIIHGIMDLIMMKMGISWTSHADPHDHGYFIRKLDNEMYLKGMQAEVLLADKVVGNMGVLHPEVLSNFGIMYPVSALELDADLLLKEFHPKSTTT